MRRGVSAAAPDHGPIAVLRHLVAGQGVSDASIEPYDDVLLLTPGGLDDTEEAEVAVRDPDQARRRLRQQAQHQRLLADHNRSFNGGQHSAGTQTEGHQQPHTQPIRGAVLVCVASISGAEFRRGP